VTEQLCLACGLCCDGTLFADVKLQPGDDPQRLRAAGLPVPRSGCCRQPCAAFRGQRCTVYELRPVHCRRFECLLIKDATAGRISAAAALRTIQRTRTAAQEVRRLLRQLGDVNENLSLSLRMRRTSSRMQQGTVRAEEAASYGCLTVAYLKLTSLLSKRFYTGDL
jgi:uncharacterized protein